MASVALSAAMVLPAWYSSQNPTAALTTRSAPMTPKSAQCRTTAERTAATSIIHGIGPQKYERSFRIGLTRSSTISL